MELNRLAAAAMTAVALLGFGPQSWAEAPPPQGGSPIATLYGELTTFDPVRVRRHADVTVSRLVFDTLYAAEAGELVPLLAAGPPQLGDRGLSVTIPVREGVVFHDGKSLAAGDVAASLRRLLRSPAGWSLAAVRRIDVDGSHVILRLRRPAPELPVALSAPTSAITRGGQAPGQVPVGTGPFRFAGLDRKAGALRLRAWERHAAGPPYLDALELRWYRDDDTEPRAYELGHIHASLRGSVAFVGHNPKYAATTVATEPTVLVYVQLASRPELPASFGRALSLAVDRRGFRAVGRGESVEPGENAVARRFGGQSGVAADHFDRATRALGEARAVPAFAARLASGRALEILVDRTRPDDRAVADRVLSALFRLRLPARIIEVSAVELTERIEGGRFDLVVDHMVSPVADGAWQAAAAVAVAEPGVVAQRLASGVPTAAAWERARTATWRVIPLFHRSMRLHARDSLHGFALQATGLISWAGVFLQSPGPAASRRKP